MNSYNFSRLPPSQWSFKEEVLLNYRLPLSVISGTPILKSQINKFPDKLNSLGLLNCWCLVHLQFSSCRSNMLLITSLPASKNALNSCMWTGSLVTSGQRLKMCHGKVNLIGIYFSMQYKNSNEFSRGFNALKLFRCRVIARKRRTDDVKSFPGCLVTRRH